MNDINTLMLLLAAVVILFALDRGDARPRSRHGNTKPGSTTRTAGAARG